MGVYAFPECFIVEKLSLRIKHCGQIFIFPCSLRIKHVCGTEGIQHCIFLNVFKTQPQCSQCAVGRHMTGETWESNGQRQLGAEGTERNER